jgi:hypothetical protein
MARRAKDAVSRVKTAVKKVAGRLRRSKHEEPIEPAVTGYQAKTKSEAKPMARKRRPQADIPLDQLDRSYTPQQTSLKAPFRASGADRQRDQEHGRGIADDRWNDEDHLTNKSGDPRIGTRGRTYEPGEKRAAKGRR